jgi:hypothetical protein
MPVCQKQLYVLELQLIQLASEEFLYAYILHLCHVTLVDLVFPLQRHFQAWRCSLLKMPRIAVSQRVFC